MIVIPLVLIVLSILSLVGYSFYTGQGILDTAYGLLPFGGSPAPPPSEGGLVGPTGKEKECPACNCPVCPACKCPECPECKCPECPPCNCPVTDSELKSLRAEKSYLEWMTRYTGALLRRESEMNRVMMEQCPGMYGMVPHVQVMDYEVRNVKDHVRKDKNMWHYFQNHFTRLTGIPSVPHKEIL